MPLIITDSPNISSLDSKIKFDLYDGVVDVDITPSVWIGGGDAYVQGVKVKIVNPLGITIKNYTNSFDISGDMSNVFTMNLPLVGGNYQYGNYEVYVKLVDADGEEYELGKQVNICPPNKEDVSKKNGCLGAAMTAKCKEGKLIVILNSPPNYRGVLPNSTENDLTLEYPTGSELEPIEVVLSNFSVALFEGVYRLQGDVNVEYLFGDNVSVNIKYKVDQEKKVLCRLDECCVQAKLEELNTKLDEACTDEQKSEVSSIILETLFLFEAAKGAQNCGLDPSNYIEKLEKLLGCTCTCNCETEGTQIGTSIPAEDITFLGCGFEVRETGLTTEFEIYNYDYKLISDDEHIEVDEPEIDPETCEKTQKIRLTGVDPDYCEDFEDNLQQGNGLSDMFILGKTLNESVQDCNLGSFAPPTGFAVSGNTRKSIYGAMEWYGSLTAANTAAASGETVLLFIDSNDSLSLKAGVYYVGIGVKTISGTVSNTASISYKGSLTNLVLSGSVVLDANSNIDSEITLNNVALTGNVLINGYVKVFGGIVRDYDKTLTVSGNATFAKYYSERHIVYTGSAKGYDIVIRSKRPFQSEGGLDILGALVLTSQADVEITRADVTAENYTAIFSNAIPDNGSCQLTHSKGRALGNGTGIYYHSGGELSSAKSIFAHCVGRSVDGDGIQAVRAYTGDDNFVSNSRFSITHNVGYSVNRYGIYSISTNMKLCHGYSEANIGIRIAGSDLASVNCYSIDCIGHSKNSYGLYSNRDTRIIGGTFISEKDAADGHPIFITKNVARPTEEYVIVGVKTISFNTDPTCYAIKGDASVNLRVSGCQFTNFFLGTGVPAIDPTITLRSVLIDYFNNVS